MSRRAAVIQFLPFEDMGSLRPVLTDRQWRITVHQPGLDPLPSRDLADADLLIVLGGPLGVHDSAEYPFLDTILELLGERLRNDRPTLGICLGAQLMAAALGATLYPGAAREVGWSPLQFTEAGRTSALSAFDMPGMEVFHWHSDRFDPPANSTALASTPQCPCQAFAHGRHGLALQFHPEVTARGLEQWYIGHTRELHSHAEPQVTALREASTRLAPQLEAACRQFFADWLQGLSD